MSMFGTIGMVLGALATFVGIPTAIVVYYVAKAVHRRRRNALLREIQEISWDEAKDVLEKMGLVSRFNGKFVLPTLHRRKYGLYELAVTAGSWIHNENGADEIVDHLVKYYPQRQIKRFILIASKRHDKVGESMRARIHERAVEKRQEAEENRHQRVIDRGLKASGYKPEKQESADGLAL